MSEVASISSLLLRSLAVPLPNGWIYLSTEPPWTEESLCLLLDQEDLDCEDEELEKRTAGAGFPCAGLDTQTVEDVCRWVLQFEQSPSIALLLESFSYYYQYDSFLPMPGAPDPPSVSTIRAKLDREFYESLGEERPEQRCQMQDCSRGAVPLSVFCRQHHFESVKKKSSPFSD